MRTSRWFFFWTYVLFASPALALDITVPDQVIPPGQVGVLQADLVCLPPRVGVFVSNGARLEMNGHSLDGCTIFQAGVQPVRMTVRGPGVVRHAGIGIRSGTLRVQGVTVEDSPTWGILGSGDSGDGPSTLRLRDVVVTGSGLDGIRGTRVSATRVTSSGNGVVGPSGVGILGGGGVKGRDLEVADNQGAGVFAFAGKVVLHRSSVTGNQSGVLGLGISRGALKLVDSTVLGNDVEPDTYDLASQREPLLRGASTCGSSIDSQTLLPWGVCTND